MRFSASLDPGSAISRNWRMHNRLSGHLSAVVFHWRGGIYASGELTAAQVEAFNRRQDKAVRLEVFGVLPETAVQQDYSVQQDHSVELPKPKQALRTPHKPQRRRLE